MKDIDVRQALERQVLREHNADPDTLVVHELGVLGGASRVDIAVVNGTLHGIEIKSERDTLDRLAGQSEAYSLVFDKVTIVCGAKHLSKVENFVPEWWGIKVATAGPRGGIELSQQRFPKLNRSLDPEALASLLWKDEALSILEKYGAAKGVRSKNKAAIYRRLSESLSLDVLRDCVRDCLKAREGWRSD
ncbi:sce7726 family protein [Thalassospira permensis]|uniref:Sce7726 family protein n=1 Tax=Thalassospira permensis NBRC 106175 TaxID=1353532 RepID=A0ABR4TVS7_9PROT|nr:sce7726 family protein [Thalassospira permensis]KEO59411.1 hypothetical protein SMB34_00085 [Thalassospira permensis NBRC 106175]